LILSGYNATNNTFIAPTNYLNGVVGYGSESFKLKESYTHFEKIMFIIYNDNAEYKTITSYYIDEFKILFNIGSKFFHIINGARYQSTLVWTFYTKQLINKNAAIEYSSTDQDFKSYTNNCIIADIFGINRIYPMNSSVSYEFKVNPVLPKNTTSTDYLISSDTIDLSAWNSDSEVSSICFDLIQKNYSCAGADSSYGNYAYMVNHNEVFSLGLKFTGNNLSDTYLWLSAASLSNNNIRNGDINCWTWTNQIDYIKDRNINNYWYAFTAPNTYEANPITTNAYGYHTFKNIPPVNFNDYPYLSAYTNLTFVKNTFILAHASHNALNGSLTIIYKNHNPI
jgi:hypothetical protein